MRYYIDTHIVLFIVEDTDSLTREVKDILEDYGNRIYISFECVRELVMLHQSGKIDCKRWKTAKDIIDFIVNDTDIEIKYMAEDHLYKLADLPYFEDHKDPFDRMIIAHAINDKMPIISSDRKFRYYEKHGLNLIFNKR